MEEHKVHEKIRDQIRQDIKPVAPMAPAPRRAMPLLILWMALVAIVLAVFGMRSDYDTLGAAAAWSLPLLQLIAAYIIVTFALRLTVPGSAVPSSLVILAAFFGISVHLLISAVTFYMSPTYVEPSRVLPLFAICFSVTLCLGLIPLVMILFLCAKGFSSRPGIIGLVSGLGCGLTGEAAWRMHCHYSAGDHVLFAHLGAVLVTALLGWLLAYRYLRRRTIR